MNANELADLLEHGAYPTGTREQAATMLRQIGLAESIIKQQQAEIESLKNRCFEFQNAAIDLAKKNAFLEDWQKTWSPYIKEAHGINTTILRKAQEK